LEPDFKLAAEQSQTAVNEHYINRDSDLRMWDIVEILPLIITVVMNHRFEAIVIERSTKYHDIMEFVK
jgi:hypothetical protein